MTDRAAETAGVLERWLHIRCGEERKVAILFGHLLLASGIFVLGRTARDTLFLSRFPDPARLLPWMFVAYGVVSALASLLIGKIADRFDRPRLIAASAAVAATSYVGFWVLVRLELGWAIAAFWVWSEVAANLLLIEFWTFAADLNDPRDAKRLAGTIGSARILGVVVFGVAGAAAVSVIRVEQLLLLLAALIAATGFLPRLLRGEVRVQRESSLTRRRRQIASAPFADPHVRAVAAFLFLAFIVLTIGDYQFKVLARRSYDREELAHFFSLFYAGAGSIAFVFQIFGTPRLLARFGAVTGLAVMPSLFGLLSGVLIVSPRLAIAAIMKFCDNGLQFTIHETSLQALYVPVRDTVKARVRTLLEAAIKPLAYGLGGLALALLAPLVGSDHVERLSWLSLILVAPWLLLLPVIRRRYLAALEQTIGRPSLAESERSIPLDVSGRRLLVQVLGGVDPRPALRALGSTANVDFPELRERMLGLCRHPEAEVRADALHWLAAVEEVRALQPAVAALGDESPRVRTEAVRAAFLLAGDDAVDPVRPLLDDSERAVRIAAISGLFRNGGVDGALAAAPRLAALLASPVPSARQEGAEVLRRLGREAYRPLRGLLDDPDPAVRRRALRAAAAVADPRLTTSLFDRLADRASRAAAAEALAAIGIPAVPLLGDRLADEATSRAVRIAIPRILRAIPAGESTAALRRAEASPDSYVRLRVYSALGRLRAELHGPPRPLAELAPRLDAELVEAMRLQAAWLLVAPRWQTPLLEREFRFRFARAERRVLRLLEQRIERRELDAVRRNLWNSARRGRATELLDGLLEPTLRRRVLALFDDSHPAEKVRVLARETGIAPPNDALALVRAELSHPAEVIRFLWLDAIRAHREPAFLAETTAAIADRSPLVREASARAVAALLPPAAARPQIEVLATDPDPCVRTTAIRILSSPEAAMISTLEKILFLESVPLFARLSGDDLAPVARVAEVASFRSGETVFDQGEPSDAIYIVMRGEVEVVGSGRVLATCGPGEELGEMGVLDGSPRAATIRAAGEVDLLRIGAEDFREILHEEPELAEGILLVLAQRLREADRKLGMEPA